MSTSVVTNGLAITAGSRPSFTAKSGREAPISFDMQTVTTSVSETASATKMLMSLPLKRRSTVIIFTNIITERTVLQRSATRNSLNKTFRVSESFISLRESALITVIALCEPQLPPVPISIGIKTVKATFLSSALSNAEIITPVAVEVSVKRRSHGILFLKMPNEV